MKKITLCFILLFSFFYSNESQAQRTGTSGTPSYFLNAVSKTIRSVRLSDDKVLISYKNNSNQLFAVVGTVSGSSISYGTSIQVSTPGDFISNLSIDIVLFTPSKALIVYEENLTPDVLRYNVLDISGTTVTANAVGTLGPGHDVGSLISVKAAALSDNLVVVIYEESTATNGIRYIAGTLNGTTITWGSVVNGDTNIDYTDIVRLSDSKFAVAYEHNDGVINGEGKIVAGTVSGTTISLGTPQSFESSSFIRSPELAALSETELVLAYEDDGDIVAPVDQGKIRYVTVSGNTFSFPGAITNFSTDDAIGGIDLDVLSSTEVFLGIERSNGNNSLFATGLLSGNNITMSSETIFLASGEADDIQVNALNSNTAVISYTDDNGISGTTDGGEARVVTFSATTNPEINVQGNSTSIILGDATPTSGDHTDFGTGASLSRTFTIENLGTGTLTLGSSAVTITGANAADFSVSTQPSTTVGGNSTATFTINFSSAVASTRNAEIHINNDDIHEYDYFYSIQAVGGPTLGIEDFEETGTTIKLFPNPSINSIQISGLTKRESYTIVNELGSVLIVGSISNNEDINIKNLQSGLYFLTLKDGKTIKFIRK